MALKLTVSRLVLVSSISHSISVVLVDGLKSGNVDTGDSEIVVTSALVSEWTLFSLLLSDSLFFQWNLKSHILIKYKTELTIRPSLSYRSCTLAVLRLRFHTVSALAAHYFFPKQMGLS
ncbi:hypothetical protein B0I73DRAFT_141110 [Yarrowia lipolytica]|nr:hypothetical protein BKA91DRAFT_126724 [Yarrowia lipolytica]KAE8174760.1 hypothetical protein BKA90DRAFT_126505 [Yarrowia lipolytica]RDW39293.1 hypothetical protein B0I73DRAFT_141110 [Yarrowia lipolytica]RMI97646.1 hypothetical protein BD777DRAFT_135532 [Yarrowia lipolytica]